MTQEEKQLLLKEVCARLPYGVKINIEYYDLQGNGELKNRNIVLSQNNIGYCFQNYHWVSFKPYLRPMSSMTEEEKDDYENYTLHWCDKSEYGYASEIVDYLNQHHFDYRDLIHMGLALEAPEGMYKTE